jgi:hypothetical protein
MAADKTTIKKVRSYMQNLPASNFLLGMFQAPAENFHNSKKIEWDIDRDSEDIAVPVQNVSDGYRQNQTGDYDTKEALPPSYKEEEVKNNFDLYDRAAGSSTYDSVDFQRNATNLALKSAEKLRKKVVRAEELQASQILTTGELNLTDAAGESVYALSFKPKATHFPTVGTLWAANPTTATPISDIDGLCEVNRDDSGEDSKRVVMSAAAFEAAMATTQFQNRFDNRRVDLGAINPMPGQGGTRGGNYRGTIDVGSYKLDVWTYGGRYKDPQTGNMVKYIADDKVIVMGDGMLDAHFGGFPTFGNDGRAIRYIPRRMMSNAGRTDMFFNNWISPNGEELHITVASRPLLVPKAIDTFGCLTV